MALFTFLLFLLFDSLLPSTLKIQFELRSFFGDRNFRFFQNLNRLIRFLFSSTFHIRNDRLLLLIIILFNLRCAFLTFIFFLLLIFSPWTFKRLIFTLDSRFSILFLWHNWQFPRRFFFRTFLASLGIETGTLFSQTPSESFQVKTVHGSVTQKFKH